YKWARQYSARTAHGHDQCHELHPCADRTTYRQHLARQPVSSLLYHQYFPQRPLGLENGLASRFPRAAGNRFVRFAGSARHPALTEVQTAQIDTSPCPSRAEQPSRHLQTEYGLLMARYQRIAFARERVNPPDGDFLDFDWTGSGMFSDRFANGQPAQMV